MQVPVSQPECDLERRLCIVVVSCDKYADLWQPFFELFRRFWPDCRFRVFLLSNTKDAGIPWVTTIKVGDDRSWSGNLMNALQRLEYEYVMMVIDDLFLCERVDNRRVEETLQVMLDVGANYLRFRPNPPPDAPCNRAFGEVSKGTVYRASTVFAAWRREMLLSLLRDGENAWEFEVHGTVRSDEHDGFYSTHEPMFCFMNGVIKGKWERRAVKQLQSHGVQLDLAARRVSTRTDQLVLRAKVMRSKVLGLFPAKYRRKIKDLALRGRYNYKLKR